LIPSRIGTIASRTLKSSPDTFGRRLLRLGSAASGASKREGRCPHVAWMVS
jgi:hypothetical protein